MAAAVQFRYNSCRNRHGPSCQSLARAAWIEDRTADLLDMDDGHVRFRYKNYRAAPSETPQTMTLDASEFIRRFLLHVLPRGFHRIRYDGWLGHPPRFNPHSAAPEPRLRAMRF